MPSRRLHWPQLGETPMVLFETSQSVVFREAYPEDAPTLAQLHKSAFERDWSAGEFDKLLRANGTFAIMARRKPVLSTWRDVGFVLVREAAKEAEILTIGVEPASRKRGIGRRLLDEAGRRLYADRVNVLFLEVDEANQSAVGLYRTFGFRVVGERTGYYRASGERGESGMALVMRCDLR